jgi:serine/threonine-protein kinase HipA
MSWILFSCCPGTLAAGFDSYSQACLNRVFGGRKVSPVLPYASFKDSRYQEEVFEENALLLSISGVQEKFSLIQVKNKLRLTKAGEQGTHLLKPIPSLVKLADQVPANEHLTMQLASQVYGIETAANALIFFENGEMAYLTKRFDLLADGQKLGQEDLASLLGKSPQSHGTNYKYQGSYLELAELMRAKLPAYPVEVVKWFKLILFNYLFSNGDAHLKNFSVLETPMGDYRLSPAYDLMNTRIHIEDQDFALDQGILSPTVFQGTVLKQFQQLALRAGIQEKQINAILKEMLSKSDQVEQLITASFLNERTQRSYLQHYQTRLNKLSKG